MYNSLTKVIYFITLTVVDWVDVFTRPIYKHIVIDSLRYCQENKRLRIYAWVMMSNHLHLLVDVNDEMPYEQERLELSNIIRDFKKFTSKKLVNSIEDNVQESRKDWMMNRFWYAGANDKKIKNNRFWQEGYCPEEIFSEEFLRQKINYIHQNPVRQEIVLFPEQYKYSSAIDYAGEKGLLDVAVIK